MCFEPQRRATFHLSSPQMSSHPPLLPAYFSTLRSHKTTKKHSVSRLSYVFAHLHLLSSDLFSSDSSPCWLLFHLSILSEIWLLNFLRLLCFWDGFLGFISDGFAFIFLHLYIYIIIILMMIIIIIYIYIYYNLFFKKYFKY
jgi:hypothetical protein